MPLIRTQRIEPPPPPLVSAVVPEVPHHGLIFCTSSFRTRSALYYITHLRITNTNHSRYCILPGLAVPCPTYKLPTYARWHRYVGATDVFSRYAVEAHFITNWAMQSVNRYQQLSGSVDARPYGYNVLGSIVMFSLPLCHRPSLTA